MAAYVQSMDKTGKFVNNMMWKRRLAIKFSSLEAVKNGKGMSITIGDNDDVNFTIRISGGKKMSMLQDKGTIEISNMSYDTIAQIINFKLYKIEINVGYENGNFFTIAKGEVSYIQQKIKANRDVTLYIMYASEFVARWSQSRINYSIRSGINVYDMLNYLFIREGIPKTNLSKELKSLTLSNIQADNQKMSTVIEQALASSNTGFCLSTDSSFDNAVVSVTDLKGKKAFVIDPNMININNGNPTISSSGLAISFFPVYDFCPGDVIKIENRIIDTSSGMTDAESVISTFNANYIDQNGCYLIREVNYTFENRGDNFFLDCKAIALSVISGITGVIT